MTIATREARAKNPESMRRANQRWHAANPEKARASERQWRENNREKDRADSRERVKRWRERHPEGAATADRVRATVRRQRVAANGGFFTEDDLIALLIAQGELCVLCGFALDDEWQVDHKIPIVKGGNSWPENIQLVHPICNRRKHTKVA